MRSTTARAASMRARASAETSTCRRCRATSPITWRSEEHTSELQSRLHLVCRLLLEKKKGNLGRVRPRRQRNGNHQRRRNSKYPNYCLPPHLRDPRSLSQGDLLQVKRLTHACKVLH